MNKAKRGQRTAHREYKREGGDHHRLRREMADAEAEALAEQDRREDLAAAEALATDDLAREAEFRAAHGRAKAKRAATREKLARERAKAKAAASAPVVADALRRQARGLRAEARKAPPAEAADLLAGAKAREAAADMEDREDGRPTFNSIMDRLGAYR